MNRELLTELCTLAALHSRNERDMNSMNNKDYATGAVANDKTRFRCRELLDQLGEQEVAFASIDLRVSKSDHFHAHVTRTLILGKEVQPITEDEDADSNEKEKPSHSYRRPGPYPFVK